MASTESLLIALISALGVGLPSLAYTIWRGRKLGPKEEEALVTKTAQEAVQTMSSVLDAARAERLEMQEQMAEDEERIAALEERVRELEEEVATLKGG